MSRVSVPMIPSVSRWHSFALAALFLSGCAIHQPPEYETAAVSAVCNANSGDTLSVSYKGKTRLVTVNFVESWSQLDSVCGKTGGACVYYSTPWDTLYEHCQSGGGDCMELASKAANRIYMLESGNCLYLASHELGHVFGVAGLDRPRSTRRH